MTWVYLLKSKADTFTKFQEWCTEVENQVNHKVKTLRSDNGEFVNTQFDAFCKKKGIRRQLSTPYTPQQKGVVERKNRTMLEMAHCMIYHANLSFVHVPEQKRTKLDSKSRNMVFVGYSSMSKAFRMWDPTERKIVISRDVVFDEDFHDLKNEDISFPSSPTSIILNDDTTSQPNGGPSTSSLVPKSISMKMPPE